MTSSELPPRVASGLSLAEISPSRRGKERRARLTEAEHALYAWVLRQFATRDRPSGSEVRARAERLGLEHADAVATFTREDLVHLDHTGEIAVAYPFSGRPSAHRVRFPDGHEVFAMCAIDALGVAPMFGQPIEVASSDPLTRAEIHTRVSPDGEVSWQPEAAVVVAGVASREGDSCACCCPVLNFFASADSAERWLAEHPGVRGEIVTVDEAAAAGRAVFGDVLR